MSHATQSVTIKVPSFVQDIEFDVEMIREHLEEMLDEYALAAMRSPAIKKVIKAAIEEQILTMDIAALAKKAVESAVKKSFGGN